MTMPSFDDVKSKATGLVSRTRPHKPASGCTPPRQTRPVPELRDPDSCGVPPKQQHPRGPRPLPTKPASSTSLRTTTTDATTESHRQHQEEHNSRQDERRDERASPSIPKTKPRTYRFETTGLQVQTPAHKSQNGCGGGAGNGNDRGGADTGVSASARAGVGSWTGIGIESAGSGPSTPTVGPATTATTATDATAATMRTTRSATGQRNVPSRADAAGPPKALMGVGSIARTSTHTRELSSPVNSPSSLSSLPSTTRPISPSLVPAALRPRPPQRPPQHQRQHQHQLLWKRPSPPSPSSTGARARAEAEAGTDTSLEQKQAVLRTSLALCKDPQSVTFADIHAAATTAEDFRDQMVSSARRGHHVEQRYGHGITERLEHLTIRNGDGGDAKSEEDSRSSASEASPTLPPDIAKMLTRKKAPPPRPTRKPVPAPTSAHGSADMRIEEGEYVLAPEPWDSKHAFL